MLNRREMIELTLRAAALPGGAAFFDGWLRAGQVHNHAQLAPPQLRTLQNYRPKFFEHADFEALQAFSEILIPTDEDPGAREAYCAHFIDFVLNASDLMPENQKNWRHAMELLNATGFPSASRDRQVEIVTEISRPELDPTATHPAFPAYRLIKSQNTFAFYTSRVGMIETLNYKGNSYNAEFPACNHPEHQIV